MGKDELARFKDEVQKKIDAANGALDALGKKKEVEVSA